MTSLKKGIWQISDASIGLDVGLFCFALLCFALLCFALLCFALLCFDPGAFGRGEAYGFFPWSSF